jgi:hypothetical protein
VLQIQTRGFNERSPMAKDRGRGSSNSQKDGPGSEDACRRSAPIADVLFGFWMPGRPICFALRSAINQGSLDVYDWNWLRDISLPPLAA